MSEELTVDQLRQDPKWNGVPREILVLAVALSKIHGTVDIRSEASGRHLYMASPMGVEKDGSIELAKRHLAVNADKYLRLGRYSRQSNSNIKGSAMCMKYRVPYSVRKLLAMPKLEDRLPEEEIVRRVSAPALNEAWLVTDEATGRRIPAPPGRCTPLTDLEPNHVAVQYLTNRGFDLALLVDMFNSGYCEAEYPEDVAGGRKYRRMAQGFNDTPQGRITFEALIDNVRVSWQARILEQVRSCGDGTVKMYWHPYLNMWVDMEVKNPETGKFEALPDVQKDYFDWNPSKYKTAAASRRSETIIGVDHAVRWNTTHRPGKPRVGVLVEGPLDVGKIRGPGMAMIGSHLSDGQASILLARFEEILYVADLDGEAGLKAMASVRAQLLGKCRFTSLSLEEFQTTPDNKVDVGGLTYTQTDSFLHPYLFK